MFRTAELLGSARNEENNEKKKKHLEERLRLSKCFHFSPTATPAVTLKHQSLRHWANNSHTISLQPKKSFKKKKIYLGNYQKENFRGGIVSQRGCVASSRHMLELLQQHGTDSEHVSEWERVVLKDISKQRKRGGLFVSAAPLLTSVTTERCNAEWIHDYFFSQIHSY